MTGTQREKAASAAQAQQAFIMALETASPQIHPSAFIAPTAAVIGQVTVGEQASVWFGAVLRGDIEPVVIGARSNVQDGAVLHTEAGWPCILEEDVTVGHGALVHSARCEAGSLVGMNATMLNGSSLGPGAVLAAGALLLEGQRVEAGQLAVGVPARVVGAAPKLGNAGRYVAHAARYRALLSEQAAPETGQPT
ncbi:gamma carbonic anhydrase family protein [Deinococcus lacus]|uniref:Gamma carbonic anhydrase family protein n=1 Tax=Deinococcus lacus TaxID=392561 RepID=A0ABW1YCA4_9DEIO